MNRFLLSITATVWCAFTLFAQPAPRPPCGNSPVPDFPDQVGTPTIEVWNALDWAPAACTGWAPSPAGIIVTAAARFQFAAGAEGLRRRVGAISRMSGLLYWSSTRQQWRPLIIDAYAVTGPDDPSRREDFAPREVSPGRRLYFRQEDSLLGKMTVELHVLAAAEGRLVFATENRTEIRILGLTLFAAGDLQSICFLDRESNRVWRYYGIARMPKQAATLSMGRDQPFINRAVALFRYLADVPSDREPPAAR